MTKKTKYVKLDGVEYLLKEQKGSGGSGVVRRVESNGKTFAVKFITGIDGEKISRFENELNFCRKSSHKNIVKVIASGEYEGMKCYVMPFYSKTLRDVIKEEKDFTLFIKYILKICNALKFIHKKGIVHRDVKPENILVEGDNLVLADFGIAHFKEYQLTKKGDLLVNRNYVAPEQKIKNNALHIEKSADIYALGLIINECFTKQNPSGSRFRLIADDYPLLSELDSLVENMINQEPKDRMQIETVETEIKFIFTKLKQNLEEVNSFLTLNEHPPLINKLLKKTIIRRASNDILTGEYVFRNYSSDLIGKYNDNWHMKIGYSVDDFLFNLYIQEGIFSLCKMKFDYESNIYKSDNWYKTLDLETNEEHKSLYLQLIKKLERYRLHSEGSTLLDLSGTILKYFSSCSDHHCKSILKNIINLEKSAEQNLRNAPILWIVSTLKNGIKENMDLLIKRHDGLFGTYEFNFAEHIFINWYRTKYFISNDDDENLLDSSYFEKEYEVKKILNEFRLKWKVEVNRLNDRLFSVKFTSYKQYQKFRIYALEFARPHNIFEGDVLDILDTSYFVGNMIELRLDRIFDIPNTLAKVIGLKNLDD